MQSQTQKNLKTKQAVNKSKLDSDFEKMKQKHSALLNNNPHLKNIVSNLIQAL